MWWQTAIMRARNDEVKELTAELRARREADQWDQLLAQIRGGRP